MANLHGSNILRKIIYSYIALLLIPVAAFTCFVYFIYNQYLIKAQLDEQQYIADRCLEELNMDMFKYNNLVIEIKKNKLFYLEFAREMPVAFIDIRNYLRNAESTLNYSAALAYCDLSRGEIYTAHGMTRYDPDLSEVVSQCSYIDESKWVILDNQSYYVVPLESNSNDTLLSVLIISLDRGRFQELLQHTPFTEERTILSRVICGGRILYSSADTAVPQASKCYRISASSSFQNRENFIVEQYIQRNFLFHELYLPIAVSFGCILIILLASGATFYISVKRNIFPLQGILRRLLSESYLNTAQQAATQSPVKDDLVSLDTAITGLLDLKQELLENNRALAKEHWLSMLLYNRDKDSGALAPVPLECTLPGPCYVCVCIEYPSGNNAALSFPVPYEALSLDSRSTAFILSESRPALENCLASFPKPFDSAPQILAAGVGNIVEGLAQIHDSFFQAGIAKREAFGAPNHLSIFSEQVSHQESLYPDGLMHSLESACRCADTGMIAYITDQIHQAIAKAPSRFAAIWIYQDYLKTVAGAMEALHGDSFNLQKLYRDACLKAPRSKEDLLDSMREVSALVLEWVEAGSQNRPKLSLESLLEYLSIHYLDSNFSLKTMADDFQTSQSNLSHFFKKETQNTLSEYVDSLKIEYAKKALAGPNCSISAVSRALGFASPSTFIKKFKRMEGVTPGEYRDQVIPSKSQS